MIHEGSLHEVELGFHLTADPTPLCDGFSCTVRLDFEIVEDVRKQPK